MNSDPATPSSSIDADERLRRWRLALGSDGQSADAANQIELSERDARIDKALSMLYGAPDGKKRSAGLGRSAPRVARWLDDIRNFFPTPVVQVVQKDAFERLGLKQLLLDPEFLATVEADVHLVADLIDLKSAMPARAKETARQVVRKVVEELMKRLESRTIAAIRGALDRSRRTHRPRFADIDWPRTILANLRHYQRELGTVIPERLIGFARQQRRASDLNQVILCVDQSGSMAASVVYASIFAAVMASIPAVVTKLVLFDTTIVDLTEALEDPVDVLFGVQLGGGTDINQALAYCEKKIERPTQTHLILITDLYEGGDAQALVGRAARLIQSGVNLITLLALSDEGHPGYHEGIGRQFSALGSPCFACTPDQFPDLMAAALKREDLTSWAAERDIALLRGA